MTRRPSVRSATSPAPGGSAAESEDVTAAGVHAVAATEVTGVPSALEQMSGLARTFGDGRSVVRDSAGPDG
jgi:hypothetical protein